MGEARLTYFFLVSFGRWEGVRIRRIVKHKQIYTYALWLERPGRGISHNWAP